MRNQPISRVMTPSPATVGPTDSASAAERLMLDRGFHHVPVVDGGRLLGMVGRSDLLKALVLSSASGARAPGTSALESRQVTEIMQRTVVALGPNATVLQAAEALAQGDTHALSVVAPGNILVGIVTSTDLIELLADGLKHPAGEPTSEPAETGPAPTIEEMRALRQVFGAAVRYLASGRADQEHVRLLQAVDRARESLAKTAVHI
jgi:CBS domain-containing membrane protein